MAATLGDRDDRSGGRTWSRTSGNLEWPRVDRTGLLAVSLSFLTVLSLFAVPASGVTLAGSGPAASVDDGVSAPDPLTKGGPPGGNSGGGGSNAGGGGSGGGGSSGGGSAGSGSAGSGSGGGGSGGGSTAGQDGGSSSGGSGGGGSTAGGASGGGSSSGTDSGGSSGGNGGSKGGDASNGTSGNGDGASKGGDASNGNGGNGNGGSKGGDASNGNGGNGNGNDASNGGNGKADDGPSVSVTAGGQGERDRGAGRGASGGPSPTSVVSVAVENARAGDRVDLDVSPAPIENDAVAFDGISMTVERDGDFTMEVTNSRGRLSGSPAFEPDQSAESLGRIRLNHSISNDEVEEVTYTFRVSKDRLEATDTDPEEVSLFRHADGGWNELPTDVVGETETHYLLSSDSPGMSEFAVGAKRPDFDTFWADVGAGSVGAGEAVTVRGRVTNDGGADGVYHARLVVDGEVVAERSITIAAGGTRQVNFRARLERPGARRVSINGVPAGEVAVQPRLDDSAADGSGPAMAVLVDRLLDVSNALGITSPSASGAG